MSQQEDLHALLFALLVIAVCALAGYVIGADLLCEPPRELRCR